MMRRSLQKVVDMVLPPRCPMTGDVVDLPGTLSPDAWKNLSFIANPYCVCCGLPFDFAPSSIEKDSLCAACLADRPDYTTARAAMAYDDASRDFILGFKHGDQMHAVVAMVPFLKLAGGDVWAQADYVLPVPLHRWRLLRRRYNQAGVMARAMARETGVAYLPDALMRIRATKTQGRLGVRARAENVRHAFSIRPGAAQKIAGKKLILMDDVYTTGATVRECAKLLLKAGAAEVHVITLARVIKPVRVNL